MSDFDPTNHGALFKNEQKKGDKSPDYSGTLNVNGQEFRIAGWIRTARTGRKFLALMVNEKDADDARTSA